MLTAPTKVLDTSPNDGWDEKKVKKAISIGGRDDRAIALVIATGFPNEQPEHPGCLQDGRINNSY